MACYEIIIKRNKTSNSINKLGKDINVLEEAR